MIIEKKFITYIVIGFFCIPVLAGEKAIQKKIPSMLEKYWLVTNAIKKQECPQEINKKIISIEYRDDIIQIEKFLKEINPRLTSAMIKQIFRLNKSQQEGLSHLIENKKYREKAFAPDEYAKMEMVPLVFKIACDKQYALVKLSENDIWWRDFMEHLMFIPLLSVAGGFWTGGTACLSYPLFCLLAGIPRDEFISVYEATALGAGAGAMLGTTLFLTSEVDRFQWKAKKREIFIEKQIFEPSRMPKLDFKFLNHEKKLKEWKQWKQSVLSTE